MENAAIEATGKYEPEFVEVTSTEQSSTATIVEASTNETTKKELEDKELKSEEEPQETVIHADKAPSSVEEVMMVIDNAKDEEKPVDVAMYSASESEADALKKVQPVLSNRETTTMIRKTIQIISNDQDKVARAFSANRKIESRLKADIVSSKESTDVANSKTKTAAAAGKASSSQKEEPCSTKSPEKDNNSKVLSKIDLSELSKLQKSYEIEPQKTGDAPSSSSTMTSIDDASTTLSTRAGVLEAVSTTVKTSSIFDEFSDAISCTFENCKAAIPNPTEPKKKPILMPGIIRRHKRFVCKCDEFFKM
ncbi:hypothetical protein WR25_20447 [Diploscapter pachys]|uniref:Uncharacterized protein n=1 Tax=Diploscapter pachys TaxID=2018661 RepID=A0A2A2LJ54_9BILA|nr:hypothetical protein WR25_20447 [Diploscapter pachys]